MYGTIEVLDAANLFIGDDPNNSKHLVLKTCRIIADLEEGTIAHKPGGHVVSMDLGDRTFMMPKMAFSLSGPNTDVLTDFMPSRKINYTVRANIRNIRDDTDTSIVAAFKGRMVKASYNEFEKSNNMDGSYEIAELITYTLVRNGIEVLYFDVMGGVSTFRRNGQPMFPDLARNLGLI